MGPDFETVSAAFSTESLSPAGPEGDAEATLLLRELSEGGAAALLKSDGAADSLAAADVAAFVFDSTSVASFRSAHHLMLAVTQVCLVAGMPRDCSLCRACCTGPSRRAVWGNNTKYVSQ